MSEKKVWKVRMKKSYAEATNHVAVGEVLEQNDVYLMMRCLTLHYKRPTLSSHVRTGDIKVRLFPWDTVSYVTELPDSLAWEQAEAQVDNQGDVVLKPSANGCAVALSEAFDR